MTRGRLFGFPSSERRQRAFPRRRKGGGEDLSTSLRADESAVGRWILAFVTACSFIGISAKTTDPATLLAGRTVVLSHLDVQVPVVPFFWLAPLILVLFHLVALVVQSFFREKLTQAAEASGRVSGETTAPPGGPRLADLLGVSLAARMVAPRELPDDSFLRRVILRLIFLVVDVVLPLSVLLIVEGQFLPRHDSQLLYFERSLLIVDAALIVYFVPMILTPIPRRYRWRWWIGLSSSQAHSSFHPVSQDGRGRSRRGFRWREVGRWGLTLTWRLSMLPIIAVALWAGFCGMENPTHVECGRRAPTWSIYGWPAFHLDLSSSTFSHPKNFSLVGQDLRCANFTGLDLEGVDFRYADLRGSVFDHSDLKRARFGPTSRGPQQTTNRRRARKRTDARGASFHGADLRGARLDDADLRYADFREADLSAASLRHARLQRADLTDSRFIASNLDGAWLDGATLLRAKVVCSSAKHASMLLISARSAKLVDSDFEGALTAGADLEDADVFSAEGWGFDDQSLVGVSSGNISPESEIMSRWAAVPEPSSIWFEATKPPSNSATADFRAATFDGPSELEVKGLLRTVQQELEHLEDVELEDSLATQGILARCKEVSQHYVANPRAPTLGCSEAAGTQAQLPELAAGAADGEDLKKTWLAFFGSEYPDLGQNGERLAYLLGRFFADRHLGFSEIEAKLGKELRTSVQRQPRGLVEAGRTVCRGDPQEWSKIIETLETFREDGEPLLDAPTCAEFAREDKERERERRGGVFRRAWSALSTLKARCRLW